MIDVLNVKIKYSPEVLIKYHTIFDPRKLGLDPKNPIEEEIVLTFLSQCFPSENDIIEKEIESIDFANKNYFRFSLHYRLVLGNDSFENLLFIIYAIKEYEFFIGYIDTSTMGGVTVENAHKLDRDQYNYALELVKALRNLLYIRDLHKGTIKINFEINEIIKSKNGQLSEGNKDHEYSVLLKSNANYKELDIINAAIKSVSHNIEIFVPFNRYLNSHFFTWNNPPVLEEPTYDIINTIYESLLEVDLNQNKRMDKMNLFRGKLNSVIHKFLEEEGSLTPLNKSEKAALSFDFIAALGFIDDEKRLTYTTNKLKLDYIKGLPTDGFIEFTSRGLDDLPEKFAFIRDFEKNRKK